MRPQSALLPGGPAAAEIDALWSVMLAGGTVIFMLVMVLVAVAAVAPRREGPGRAERILVVGGGLLLPLGALSGLVAFSVDTGRALVAPPAEAPLTVEIVARQWWWEVLYRTDRGIVAAANEVRLPVGRPVEFLVRSADVIHSFWIPALGGKIDANPGRLNRTVLTAAAPGTWRGQCAEFCGGPHALMALFAVALPAEEFAAWLAKEARPAREPAEPFLARGRQAFLDAGCGACHAVRGTEAEGRIGPDLTHVGGRLSIAAGTLPQNIGTLAGWIADAQHIKPENKMPSFNQFDGVTLRAIAAWLASLE